MDSTQWLLDSDPAIVWQAMRHLRDVAPAETAAVRARVPREGLGAEILARQESDGSWRRADAPVWLSTLFTLQLLRATGIDPADSAVEAAIGRLESHLRWNNQPYWELRSADSGGNLFFEGEEEPCINGGVLSLGAYFGRATQSLARRLIGEQLDDGGWNCEAPKSSRSSFNTTICVLEGLLEYERAAGSAPAIAAARRRGEQYLLERSLFRRLTTGEVVDPAFLEFAFPPRYHYDVLRALDYLRAADVRIDARMSEAIHLVESKQQADGRWLLDRAYEEALAVPVGESKGEPSRWNTLRALRVLRWYQRQKLEGRG
ncbi:MAG TPA: hypothetical protein VKR52_20990 [Terracidiphilus sp.]|nr:hypothetical protein [Terracidiphilus sp.]